MPLLGDAPGFAWSRFVADETDMPPQGDEAPYLPQLVTLQLSDEPNLDDQATRDRMVNWFNSVSSNWPNTILVMNNGGGQVALSNLTDFVLRGHPDMVTFDFYPWQSVYDTNQPNHTGAPKNGFATVLFSELGIYRQISRSNGIPFGCYVQTFHAVEDYDSTIYRDPSPSELRLNHNAPLAFNAKLLSDFHYNNGVSSLFNDGDGDNNPNALYYEKADCAKRVRNFGKTLVRLKPVDDGLTTCDASAPGNTSIVIIRGRTSTGSLNTIPLNFCAGAGGNTSTDWAYQRNDPYLTNNWSVANEGPKNNGQPGDVIISWFKTIDESFDGPNFNNEVYMMVVNGLTDPTGTAADCLQEIKLNFNSTVSTLQVLNPETGLAETWHLPLINGLRQLALYLNGGDAALFKDDDGSPFIGASSIAQGAPVIVAQPQSRTNTVATDAAFSVVVSGPAPMSYQWRFNGVDISGATTNSYVRTNVQLADVGSYSVAISNSQGNATSASAQLAVSTLLLYEPFNYPNVGSTVSSTGSGIWTLSGTTGTDDFLVSAGNLFYPGFQPSTGNSGTNGGVGLGVRRLFSPPINNGVVYFSTLFKMLDFGFGIWNGASTQIGALTSDDNVSFRLQVMVRSNSPSGFVFGVQKGGTGATITWDTIEHTTNETILLVGKYDFTTSPNRATLWINPSASSFGTAESANGFISSTTGINGLAIDRFNFRQNSAATLPAAMKWDELRVATKWSDVTPTGASHIDFAKVLPVGRIQISATVSGSSATVQTSPDLSGSWSDAALISTPNGQLIYTEPVVSALRRFYRIKSGQ
ncbi:MAG: hypothetical protein JWO95_2564 [Verrucomicrobiales bacterium]|nr:hypothetical protein [Verrucomicrobiales bacterium]